jgi:hypothetical protein
MYSVKLSDKTCLFCGKSGDTAVVKSKEHDAQVVVCSDHLFALLKKWDKEALAANQSKDEPKSKEPSRAASA